MGMISRAQQRRLGGGGGAGGYITEETIGLPSPLVILIGSVVPCSLICVCQGLFGK